jgi:hypothetical protein
MSRDGVVGLYDLIAEAHARCPTLQAIREGCDTIAVDGDNVWRLEQAWERMEAGLAAAAHGDFLLARRAADYLSRSIYWLKWEHIDLNFFPAWEGFGEACALAERIDSFLAMLAREKGTGALARECYKDLSLLQILADWEEENGRSATAADARHLYGLVRYRGR